MNFFYISDVKDLPQGLSSLSLIIGNFDGVHLGHRELVRESLNWCGTHGGQSVVLTFHPHPLAVLKPEYHHSRLFSLEDQKNQFKELGIQGILLQAFDDHFRNLSADEFLNLYILKNFQPKHLVVGHDFGFGRNRAGNLESLTKFAEKNTIGLKVVPPLSVSGEVVSTSKIRNVLSQGDVEKARLFLGRYYRLNGEVIHGAHRGSSIGFPTANLKVDIDSVSLRRGVYCTKAILPEGIFNSVTNVGLNPTVSNDAAIKIETHIFGISRSLYAEKMSVEFHHYLRDEQRFSSVDELKKQIQKDAQQAKEFFGE